MFKSYLCLRLTLVELAIFFSIFLYVCPGRQRGMHETAFDMWLIFVCCLYRFVATNDLSIVIAYGTLLVVLGCDMSGLILFRYFNNDTRFNDYFFINEEISLNFKMAMVFCVLFAFGLLLLILDAIFMLSLSNDFSANKDWPVSIYFIIQYLSFLPQIFFFFLSISATYWVKKKLAKFLTFYEVNGHISVKQSARSYNYNHNDDLVGCSPRNRHIKDENKNGKDPRDKNLGSVPSKLSFNAVLSSSNLFLSQKSQSSEITIEGDDTSKENTCTETTVATKANGENILRMQQRIGSNTVSPVNSKGSKSDHLSGDETENENDHENDSDWKELSLSSTDVDQLGNIKVNVESTDSMVDKSTKVSNNTSAHDISIIGQETMVNTTNLNLKMNGNNSQSKPQHSKKQSYSVSIPHFSSKMIFSASSSSMNSDNEDEKYSNKNNFEKQTGSTNTSNKLVDNNSTSHKSANAKRKARLSDIFTNGDALDAFMQHLSKEFSIEMMLAFIEFTQFRVFMYHNIQCLFLKSSKDTTTNNKMDNKRNKIIMESLNQIFILSKSIPLSNIIYNDKTTQILSNYSNGNTTNDSLLMYCCQIGYKLYKKYIAVGSVYEINIPSQMRRDIIVQMNEKQQCVNNSIINIEKLSLMFEASRFELSKLLQFSFSRFVLNKAEFAKVYAMLAKNRKLGKYKK